jgi:hypothetical protein
MTRPRGLGRGKAVILDAAKSAVRYEKPALLSVDSKVEDKRQYVARISHPSANLEQWLKHYGSMKIEEPVQ